AGAGPSLSPADSGASAPGLPLQRRRADTGDVDVVVPGDRASPKCLDMAVTESEVGCPGMAVARELLAAVPFGVAPGRPRGVAVSVPAVAGRQVVEVAARRVGIGIGGADADPVGLPAVELECTAIVVVAVPLFD